MITFDSVGMYAIIVFNCSLTGTSHWNLLFIIVKEYIFYCSFANYTFNKHNWNIGLHFSVILSNLRIDFQSISLYLIAASEEADTISRGEKKKLFVMSHFSFPKVQNLVLRMLQVTYKIKSSWNQCKWKGIELYN